MLEKEEKRLVVVAGVEVHRLIELEEVVRWVWQVAWKIDSNWEEEVEEGLKVQQQMLDEVLREVEVRVCVEMLVPEEELLCLV